MGARRKRQYTPTQWFGLSILAACFAGPLGFIVTAIFGYKKTKKNRRR